MFQIYQKPAGHQVFEWGCTKKTTLQTKDKIDNTGKKLMRLFNSIPLPPSPTTGTPQLTLPLLSRTMRTANYVSARLTKMKRSFVTYVTQDSILTASSLPSPPS